MDHEMISKSKLVPIQKPANPTTTSDACTNLQDFLNQDILSENESDEEFDFPICENIINIS